MRLPAVFFLFWITSILLIPLLSRLSVRSGLLRFISGETPADLLATSNFSSLNFRQISGCVSPVMEAVQRGHTSIALRLLEEGAPAEVLDQRTGLTPLHSAAEQGNVRVVKVGSTHTHTRTHTHTHTHIYIYIYSNNLILPLVEQLCESKVFEVTRHSLLPLFT